MFKLCKKHVWLFHQRVPLFVSATYCIQNVARSNCSISHKYCPLNNEMKSFMHSRHFSKWAEKETNANLDNILRKARLHSLHHSLSLICYINYYCTYFYNLTVVEVSQPCLWRYMEIIPFPNNQGL